MFQQFDYYDVVAHVIPGTLGCVLLLYMLDALGVVLPTFSPGSLTQLGVGVVMAYVVGHLLQAIASSLEPLYFLAWGGRPSIKLLERESSSFSEEQRRKLVTDLASFLQIVESCPEDKKGRRSFYQRLFERCMAFCNREKLGRVQSFHASYAFNRVVLTTFILFGTSALGVVTLVHWHVLNVAKEKQHVLWMVVTAAAVGTLIEFFRARKRAYYYAREVIWMTADRLNPRLDSIGK